MSGQLSESEEKHLRLRVRQLLCGSPNGMRIRQSSLKPYTPRTGAQIPRDCGAIPGRGLLLTAERGVREEIVVGNACGGKPGGHGSKAMLLGLGVAGGASPVASLPPQASVGSWTTQRLAHHTPEALTSE